MAGSGHIESALISAAGDQYASMPSVHVAWAVWCALAVYPVARHWAVRALAIAYPLVTTLVVVATGNHFFLDVIAGALLALRDLGRRDPDRSVAQRPDRHPAVAPRARPPAPSAPARRRPAPPTAGPHAVPPDRPANQVAQRKETRSPRDH